MPIARILAGCLAVAFLAGWILVWFIHLVAILYGKWRLHRAVSVADPENLQGVSIIKPLMGVDPNLKSNLDTFFHIKYPAYEILFSVQSENDPAILLVKSLMETYPKVDAKLFIGMKPVGVNGKVNNMVKPYEAAKYDIVLVSDSGLKMEENSLMSMMGQMTPKVGMVMQMPFVVDREGFASIYEKVYFGTMQARFCLFCFAVGMNCTTGMSILMRKNVLDDAGGMAAFGRYLSEDYFFCHALQQRGYKSVISSVPALQNSGTYSVGAFHKRLIRWCTLRLSMLPLLVLFEPLSECVINGAFTSLAMQYLFDVSPLVFFLLHVLIWFLLDYALITTIENGPLKFSKFEFLVAWVMREFLVCYIFLESHRQKTITWRDKTYRLHWGGVAEEIKKVKAEDV